MFALSLLLYTSIARPPFCSPEQIDGKALADNVDSAGPFQRNWHSSVRLFVSLLYWLVKSYWYALDPLNVATFVPVAGSSTIVGPATEVAVRPCAWSTGAPLAKSTLRMSGSGAGA